MVRSTTAPPRGHVRSSALHTVLRQLEVVQVQASAAFWASPGGAEGEQLSTLSTALTTLLATMAEGRKPGMEMRLGGCPEGVGLRIYARPSGKPAPVQPEGLAFHGAAIRDRDQSLSLTDMWKASGGDKKKAPAQWLRTDAARDFVAFVAENLKCAEMHVCRTGRGSGGGTWARWQVAMAYAKYLSPAFHAWCNQVVRTHMQGQAAMAPVSMADVAGIVARAVTDAVAPILEAQRKVFEDMAQIQAQVIALHRDHNNARDMSAIGRQCANATIKGPITRLAREKAECLGGKKAAPSFNRKFHIRLREACGGFSGSWDNLPRALLGQAETCLANLERDVRADIRIAEKQGGYGARQLRLSERDQRPNLLRLRLR